MSRGHARRYVPTADEHASVVTEELSEREREVLELVSQMLTSHEIAAELYLSVNTIKTHIRISCESSA